MRKEITAIICVVLAIWFFFMGFEIGVYREKSKQAAPQPTVATTQPTIPATQPTAPVTEPSTAATVPATQPTSSAQQDTTAANTDESKPSEKPSEKPTDTKPADPSSMSKEQIIAEMEKAFKTVKAEQNCTAVKDETVTIQLTELSVSSLMDTVNNIIQNLAGAETETYTFVNGTATGVDKDGKALDGTFTMDGLLPPQKEWKVDPNGVAEATATKDGDFTTYKIKIVEENTTFDSPIPTYTSQAYSYLDLTSIDIPVAKITDAKMHYKGAEVSVTVDGSGKVTEIHYYMPMDGYGQAKVTFITGDASFEGSDDETWKFTY